jgi:hypothetical protein
VNRKRSRCHAAVLGAAAVVLVAACGGPPGNSAGSSDPPRQAPELTRAQAARILAAFDRSDSAASVAENIGALRDDETAWALDDSIAAVRRAQSSHARQAPYSHADPVFAIPPGDPGCFLVAATLRSQGSEVPQYDVSQFTRDPAGTWKLNMHALVGQPAEPELALAGESPATSSAAAISAARRAALVSQIFARTTGTRRPDLSLVSSSAVLDQQLGMGWTMYQQGLRVARMTVSRTLTASQWSACAARAGGSVIAFVTLGVTDTIRPLPGGPKVVELTPQDPDLAALGRAAPVRGASIMVSRVEEFLLSVPPSGPAAVLGLIDAPVAIKATAA